MSAGEASVRRGLWGSIRRAVSGLIAAPLEFVVASIAWSVVFVLVLSLTAVQPGVVFVFGPLLTVLGCGMLRMATVDARDDMVRLNQLALGITMRFPAKLGLGALQLILLLGGALNLSIGIGMQGLLGAAVMAMSIYVVMAAWIAGVAVWPIVLDPRRDGEGMRARIYLGLRVMFARPLQVGAIGLLAIALLYLGLELLGPLAFAPALIGLVSAHYVLPIADVLSLPPEEP